MTPNEITVLWELRRHIEHEADGFGSVYLDNCIGCSSRSFAGTLSSLQKKGLYEPQEYGFGYVKLMAK